MRGLIAALVVLGVACTQTPQPDPTAQAPTPGLNPDAGLPEDTNTTEDEIQVVQSDTGEGGPQMWCAVQWPVESAAIAGQPTETLYARVWVEGVTPSGGADPDLVVEFGHGPVGQAPNEESWQWTGGDHNPQCGDCGNNDEFMGTLTPDEPGAYHWAARVRHGSGAALYCDRYDEGRAGSNDGWSPEDAPTLSVSSPGELKIVTLNLRCLLDDWDARREIIADEIAALQPDLIGLQEVCTEPGVRDSLTELLDALDARGEGGWADHRANSHWAWDTYDEGIALLSRHGFETTQTITLPSGTGFPRRLLLARVQTPLGPVSFATTHISPRSATDRGEQIDAAIDAIEAFAGDGERTILTGDLNESPGRGVSERLEGADFVDVWRAEHPSRQGHTFPASRPRARIDYIWLRGPHIAVDEVEIILDEPIEGTFGSDHLGLRGRFSSGP